MTQAQQAQAAATVITRADVEDFLYQEAALLDEWRLEEWLDLFTDDAVYEIPATDLPGHVESDSERTFALVYDQRTLLEQRVIRLKKPTAHAEYAHSRTRRMLANVRILGVAGAEVMATANFTVFRSRSGRDVFYVGRYEYILAVTPAGLRIKHRKAVLDQEALDPHGKISIIL